ncbi:hypothetical protein JCM10207_006004 [Rhodosporidiobolus poonsookiae]
MPGKRATPASKPSSKTKSSASRPLKPSLLGLKPPAGKAKKGAQKVRDSTVREKLDQSGMELREALQSQNKPLVEKKQAPAELARGGDPLAQSMSELEMAFGTA